MVANHCSEVTEPMTVVRQLYYLPWWSSLYPSRQVGGILHDWGDLNHVKLTDTMLMPPFLHRELTLTVCTLTSMVHTELFQLPAWPLRTLLHPAGASLAPPAEAGQANKEDCFQCRDWQVFREAATCEGEVDLEEYTSSVLSFISIYTPMPICLKTTTIAPLPKRSTMRCLNDYCTDPGTKALLPWSESHTGELGQSLWLKHWTQCSDEKIQKLPGAGESWGSCSGNLEENDGVNSLPGTLRGSIILLGTGRILHTSNHQVQITGVFTWHSTDPCILMETSSQQHNLVCTWVTKNLLLHHYIVMTQERQYTVQQQSLKNGTGKGKG